MPPIRLLRRFAFVAALACSALGGCSQGLTDTGSDAASQTVGDRCSAMFAELCNQAINRCPPVGFNLSECIAANMPTCCTGTLCNATSKVTPAAAAACKQALDGEDCNSITTNQIPDACQGVLHQP